MPALTSRSRQHGGSTTSPLVSIGIPVYQKEVYLRATLDAALAQEHDNLELILADNGSTDATADICREYAARDERVRFVQNRCNLGSRRNFNLVFELARGEYFAWGRGHDLWAPQWVARGVEVLQQEPDVVLLHTRCRQIDAAGADVGEVAETLDTRGLELGARLQQTWRSALGPATLGLVRTAAMDRTRLYQDLVGCDIVFLLELATQGTFAFLDEPLLALRTVRVESSEEETVRRTWAQMNPFRSARERGAPALHVLEFAERHLALLRELPLTARERDELVSDLVDVYSRKLAGSFQQALNELADRVHRAMTDPGEDSPHALDVVTAMALFERLDVGLLFHPEHVRASNARDILLVLILDLSSVKGRAERQREVVQ